MNRLTIRQRRPCHPSTRRDVQIRRRGLRGTVGRVGSGGRAAGGAGETAGGHDGAGEDGKILPQLQVGGPVVAVLGASSCLTCFASCMRERTALPKYSGNATPASVLFFGGCSLGEQGLLSWFEYLPLT